ncbi:hypothetical protein [Kozakia baliensis]|uniref:Uncharacterized protein n=1 Tax=Kozakia baliensis TaxID=153496 RepID=A0A1D8UQ72_9PROT|nr:hypothetical protein [Kozakia baliensis]AOX15795.1 hypothetical protein A0U89_00135 [Kozakia baliensis]GBR24156.1 hypothetical protein AA0488_0319 [Kozakia baliensis NRIC 0488]
MASNIVRQSTKRKAALFMDCPRKPQKTGSFSKEQPDAAHDNPVWEMLKGNSEKADTISEDQFQFLRIILPVGD